MIGAFAYGWPLTKDPLAGVRARPVRAGADRQAADLGLDSRRLYGRAGREGLYSLNVGYAEIPRRFTEGANPVQSISSVHRAFGGTASALPTMNVSCA